MVTGKGENVRAQATLVVAAVIAMAALAVGCGGGSSSGSSSDSASTSAGGATSASTTQSGTGGPLSKAEFVKQASAACLEEGEEVINELIVYTEKHGSEGLAQPKLLAKGVKVVLLPTIEAEIAAVQKLEAPARDAGKIEAMLAEQQAVVDQLRKANKVGSFGEVENRFKAVSKKLKNYGFTACTYG